MTAEPDTRLRLDEVLVRRGLFQSRSRARDAIERATVRVAGVVARKAGAAIAPDAAIDVDDPAVMGLILVLQGKVVAGVVFLVVLTQVFAAGGLITWNRRRRDRSGR